MKIFDAHVHLAGKETSVAIARWLDENRLDRAALISVEPTDITFADMRPKPGQKLPIPATIEEQARYIEHLGKIITALPDRVVGLAWVDPTVEGALELVEHARQDLGVTGVKLIPNGWYPYEERLFSLYEKARALDMPILFHTGVLWSWGDTSRFCHPEFLEALIQFEGLRFAMGHVSWPWTDECIATAQKVQMVNRRARRSEMQAVVDLTPGTPASYRKDVLAKTFENVDKRYIIWGTDSYAGHAEMQRLDDEGDTDILEGNVPRMIEFDTEIFEALGVSQEVAEDVFFNNAMRFYGLA